MGWGEKHDSQGADLSWLEDMTLDDFFKVVDVFCRTDIIDLASRIAPDHIALAVLLSNLRYAKRLVADAEQWVEDELVKAMPHQAEQIEGIGEVEYHTGAKRSAWDKDAVIRACVQSIGADPGFPVLADTETGEAIDSVKLVGAVIRAFCDMGTPGWKVTGLRAAGINPDEYCDTVWGRKTVTMQKPEAFIPMDVDT